MLVVLVVVLGCIVLAAALVVGWRSRGGTNRGSAGNAPVEFVVEGQTITARQKERPNGSFVVQIVDAGSGNILAEGTRSVNPATRWFLGEDSGNVWLYSSDIGILVYTRTEAGWQELVWVPGKPSSVSFRIPETVFSKMSKGDQESLSAYRQK